MKKPHGRERHRTAMHRRRGVPVGGLLLAAVAGVIVLACGMMGALGALDVLKVDRPGINNLTAVATPTPDSVPFVDPAKAYRNRVAAQASLQPYTLFVTGTSSARIKYSKDRWEVDLALADNADLPWSHVIKTNLDGPFEPAITATLDSADPNGSITCEIRRGDTVVAKETVRGPNARVSC